MGFILGNNTLKDLAVRYNARIKIVSEKLQSIRRKDQPLLSGQFSSFSTDSQIDCVGSWDRNLIIESMMTKRPCVRVVLDIIRGIYFGIHFLKCICKRIRALGTIGSLPFNPKSSIKNFLFSHLFYRLLTGISYHSAARVKSYVFF